MWVDEWENKNNLRGKWEFLKHRFRIDAKNYIKSVNIMKEAEYKRLQAELILIEHQWLSNSETEDSYRRHEEALNAILEFEKEETDKRAFNAKTEYYEQGEKSTKFFYKKMKANASKTNIVSFNDGNAVLTEEKDKQDYAKRYYADIYKSNTKVNDQDPFLRRLKKNCVKITNTQSDSINKEITLEELKLAMLDAHTIDKAPGDDGIPTSVYKTFWDLFGEPLYDCLCEGIKLGELSYSQKRSNICLLLKPGKSREDIAGWRPLSLMNCDTKIFATLIANRIKRHLDKLISPTQTGFMKERLIADNSNLVQYVIETYEENKENLGIVSLDIRKAFDTIEHDYLWAILKEHNIGEYMLNLVQTLYSGAESCVLVNGQHSGYFNIERSCRQGCPLSPYLFILGIEPLIKEIQKSSKIKGIEIENTKCKVTAYADDLTIFARTVKDLWEVNSIMNRFKYVSGLELAPNKSEVMWIGPWKDNPPTNSPFNVVSEMKILGIWHTPNIEVTRKLNYEPLIESVKKKTSELKARGVSLLGRVQLVKALIYSKIQYIAAVITPNEKQIKALNKPIYNYLWKGVDQIPREKAALPIEKGGIGLEQPKDRIMAAMAINWIRWQSGTNSLWSDIIREKLKRTGGWNILSMNLNRKVWKEYMGERICCLLDAWFHFSDQKFITIIAKPESVNFHGIKLKIDKVWCTTPIFPNLLKNGVTKIGELFDHEGKKITTEIIGNTNRLLKKEYNQATKVIGKIYEYIKINADFQIGRHFGAGWPKKIETNMLTLRTIDGGMTTITKVEDLINSKHIININVSTQVQKYFDKEIASRPPEPKIIKETMISTMDKSFLLNMQLGLINGNYILKKKGKTEDETCHMCNTGVVQRNEHLFTECPASQNLWLEMMARIDADIAVQLGTNEKLFGTSFSIGNKVIRIATNKIILTWWKTIINANRYGFDPSLSKLLEELRKTRHLESTIAKKARSSYKRHKTYWEKAAEIFPLLQ
jgi:hypothetical protein